MEANWRPRGLRLKEREKREQKRKKLKQKEKMNPEEKKCDLIVQAHHQVGHNHYLRPLDLPSFINMHVLV